MRKVIIVPGLWEKNSDKKIAKHLLKNFNVFYFKYDTNLKEPLEKTSQRLNKFVNSMKLKKNEKVSIIGLSAGGIITDYYLKFINNKKVDKFISVFSPFHGSFWANFFSKKRKGIKQLIPNSSLLKKLQRKKIKKVKRLSLWCFFDPVVSGTSARGDNPKHSFFFLHNPKLISPGFPVISKVKEFLNGE